MPAMKKEKADSSNAQSSTMRIQLLLPRTAGADACLPDACLADVQRWSPPRSTASANATPREMTSPAISSSYEKRYLMCHAWYERTVPSELTCANEGAWGHVCATHTRRDTDATA